MTISHRFYFLKEKEKNKIKYRKPRNKNTFFSFPRVIFILRPCLWPELALYTIPSWSFPIAIKPKSSLVLLLKLVRIISLQYYIVAHLRPELNDSWWWLFISFFSSYSTILILQTFFFFFFSGEVQSVSERKKKRKTTDEPVVFCFLSTREDMDDAPTQPARKEETSTDRESLRTAAWMISFFNRRQEKQDV